MPEIKVVDQNNQPVGERQLNDAVFGLEWDGGFVHRVYHALASAQRAGTRSTKSRAEVSGGGRKPWRQKGTGRARQGSIRATQWRHGAVPHGPKPKRYATRINRKERRRALCLLLSEHARRGSLIVVDKIVLPEPKTKLFAKVLDDLNAGHSLTVLAQPDRTISLASRNIPSAKVVLDGQLNLHDLMKFDRLILTNAAVDKLEERLA